MSDPQHPSPTPRELLDAVGQAVIATDVGGVIVYWNAAAERLYGWPATEALGRNIVDVTVPQMSQEAAAEIMAALQGGGTWSGGFPVQRRDGSLFPALVTDSGVYRDGALVGIVGISANLGTALGPLLERAADAALVLRSDAVVTYASPAVASLFGWSPAELLGSSFLSRVHADDQAPLTERLNGAGAPGQQQILELRVRAHEDWAWAEAAVTNLRDDPIVRGVVCNLRHSVRRAAFLAAEARAEQLQEALVSRVIIEQAKGFLAGRLGVTPDAAFALLRKHARDRNLTIHAVSEAVVAGHLTLTS